MLWVVEKFVSINGEGPRAGELAAFIRFKGCNLQCSYCDTGWANQSDTLCQGMTADSLCRWALETGIKNVTLTGGEPLLQTELPLLVRQLISNGLRVEIETNGSLPLHPLITEHVRPVFTMDYKLPDSGEENRMHTDNFMLLQKEDTVKFVAGSSKDLERAAEMIEQYQLCTRCHVYLSPVFGRIDPADMVDFMKEHRMNDVRLQLQLHKFIWHPETRGV